MYYRGRELLYWLQSHAKPHLAHDDFCVFIPSSTRVEPLGRAHRHAVDLLPDLCIALSGHLGRITLFASASVDIPDDTGIKSLVLKPDQPVNNIRMPPYDGEIKLLFEGLSPNSQYDIKISYPGTTPTQFVFSKADELVHMEGLRRRRLLDTEKYRICHSWQRCQYSSSIPTHQKYGVSYDANIEQRPVVFNIVMETLVLGAIPKETFGLIIFLFLALSITYKVYLPFLRRTLEEGLSSSPSLHEKL